jgi:probable rRNA maturation factor
MTPLARISIEAQGWQALPDLEKLVGQCIAFALEETGDALAEEAEVSLLFCDDARIRDLNKRFRGQDKPTNVLSFPGPEPIEEALALGDIAIAFETVAREATEQNKTLEQHSRHMIVHGFLHLLGFDHEDDEEAEAMEALEIRILARQGVANPYSEDFAQEGKTDGRA